MSRAASGTNGKTLVYKYRYLFLLTTVLAGASIILVSKDVDISAINGKLTKLGSYEEIERATIKTEGCVIPALKPLDESIKRFVKFPSEVPRCHNSTTALLGRNRTRIWIKQNTTQYYNISEADELSCCYQSFYRPVSIEDIEAVNIDNRVKYEDCIIFNNTVDVTHEFVRVTCSVETKVIYEQYFLFAPMKEFTKHGIVDEVKNKTGYNILVLGIDSVSRLNFHRTMPKTANYLSNRGAVEFLGYNKVAENTFPNLIPMLQGITVSELKETCYVHKNATFDNCPFVWEWFKQSGYYTAFGEDSTDIATFNLNKRGFASTPTDYYLRTFIHEAEQHVGIKIHNKFLLNLCMKDVYFFKVILNYIADLTWRLKSSRLFGFFWENSMSHDFLNYPMVMDDDYVGLFEKLEASEYLDETIVFLVSDHGIRWGEIRSTKQGRLEERLPFLYILTPPSFRKNYVEAYNNLKLNSKRLITPFDLHATLSDMVDLRNLQNGVIAERSRQSYAFNRSISLFLPIPRNRTCRMADISDHWCACLKQVSLPREHPQAMKAASVLVNSLNDMLEDYPQCARLILAEVLHVIEIDVGKPDPGEKSWSELMVVVRTAPGEGVFEGTLRLEDQRWKLTCIPNRLNIYGDQSRCVDQSQLKPFCYCYS